MRASDAAKPSAPSVRGRPPTRYAAHAQTGCSSAKARAASALTEGNPAVPTSAHRYTLRSGE